MRLTGAAVCLLAVLVSTQLRAEDEGSLLGPIKLSVTPEVRSTYVSLGKIVEDRPMQVTDVHAGYDTELFGVFGVRNWDVSSLTDRRDDVHRRALYHTEVGPYWHYDWRMTESLTLKTGLTVSWTFYDGFDNSSANKSYRWYQIDQSLENPYVTPFWRARSCVAGSDYFYCKCGLRRRFGFCGSFYFTPSVFIEGGNSRNFNRVFGENVNDDWVAFGVSSVSARLEFGWQICPWATAFAYVEQYEVVGEDARDTNAESTYRCAHNDWTHGGIGVRMRF